MKKRKIQKSIYGSGSQNVVHTHLGVPETLSGGPWDRNYFPNNMKPFICLFSERWHWHWWCKSNGGKTAGATTNQGCGTYCLVTHTLGLKKKKEGFPGGAVVKNLSPMQGTRVRALVWEDPACRRATKPVSYSYWACASGACAPQQERPR